MSRFKVRNVELALAAKRDPRRFRTRTVETEPRKLNQIRSRRKRAWHRDVTDE